MRQVVQVGRELHRDITTLSVSSRDPRVLLRQATLAAAAPLWDKINSLEQLIWGQHALAISRIRCLVRPRKPWDDN